MLDTIRFKLELKQTTTIHARALGNEAFVCYAALGYDYRDVIS